jgi:hypothetical protein
MYTLFCKVCELTLLVVLIECSVFECLRLHIRQNYLVRVLKCFHCVDWD